MLYAITNRQLYGTDEASYRQHLIDQTALWAANGVAFIQLREKDLPGRDLVELARAMLGIIRKSPKQSATRLLINGRPDVALAAGADGVHLPSGSEALTAAEIREIYAAAGRTQPPILSASCHTLQEVETARQQQADCILFAPVFEKLIAATGKPDRERTEILPGTGLESLEQACKFAAPTPVFALGGITAENTPHCIKAGAAGVAAIRLMLEPASVWRTFV